LDHTLAEDHAMPLSLITSALVAVVVGFGGAVAVVIAAAEAVGATPAQTASCIPVLCMSMALGSLVLSVRSRMPLILAWSTRGAALIATSTSIEMAKAVGAFLAAGLLIVLTGLIRPLSDLAGRKPAPLAKTRLAGALFDLVAGAVIDSIGLPLLIGPFMGSLKAAFGGASGPFAPAITFVVTASGISVLSVGAPFWGLVAGLGVMALPHLPRKLHAIHAG
jgi:benzoate membrane transport protein